MWLVRPRGTPLAIAAVAMLAFGSLFVTTPGLRADDGGGDIGTGDELAFSCNKDNDAAKVVIYDSDYSHDAARTGYQLRTLDETAALSSGYRTITDMWFGTNGDISLLANFVEVGVYDGAWTDNLNYHGFFTTRQTPTVHGQVKLDAIPATAGHYATFQAAKVSSGVVRAKVTDETTGNFTYKNWGDSYGPYLDWIVGLEFTCPSTAHAVAHVYNNEYRRSSDDLWLPPESAVIDHQPNTVTTNFGSITWCSRPKTFDMFIKEPNPNCV